ncbi:hypothetical protein VP01_934g4 [Puccinia sorghi]|uniref:Uncharacterized protein n=1 Tax=Puccinia sorghi TaxID=27349 RepID=A0A0L6U7D1_9BASI|nr:hypothetical protein VP01_934g4 [Puccinia sorghi]
MPTAIFVTTQISYPIILHSCTTSFRLENKTHFETLCQQNEIDPSEVNRIFWLLNPKIASKATSTLLLIFGQTPCPQYGESGFQLPCSYLAHYCKEKAVCSRCGVNHNSASCGGMEYSSLSSQQCFNVEPKTSTTIALTNSKYDHFPLSNSCSVCTRELAILSKDKSSINPHS